MPIHKIPNMKKLVGKLPEAQQKLVDSCKGTLDLSEVLANASQPEKSLKRFLKYAVKKKIEITHLNISHGKLTALPAILSKLTTLEILNVQDNQLTDFPKEMAELKQLKILIAQHNKMTRLPDMLSKLPQLETVNVTDNPLEADPAHVLDTKKIEVFWSHERDSYTDQPEISSSTYVLKEELKPIFSPHTKQVIVKGAYSQLPNEIFQLKQLEELIIEAPIKELSPLIAHLENLKLLTICNTHLTDLPKELTQLEQLEDLSLIGNDLMKSDTLITQVLAYPTCTVKYSGQPLTALRPKGEKFDQKRFEGTRTDFIIKPAVVRNIEQDTAQTEFTLNVDQDSYAGRWLHLKYPNLTELTIIGENLPRSIFKLNQLKVLNLMLTDYIPPAIGEMQHLEHLTITGYSGQELPKEIGNLRNLRSLSVSLSKNLTRLPQEIGSLSQLQTLTLLDNPSQFILFSHNVPKGADVRMERSGKVEVTKSPPASPAKESRVAAVLSPARKSPIRKSPSQVITANMSMVDAIKLIYEKALPNDKETARNISYALLQPGGTLPDNYKEVSKENELLQTIVEIAQKELNKVGKKPILLRTLTKQMTAEIERQEGERAR